MRNKVIYGRTLLKTTGMVFSPDCSLYVALSVQDPVMSSSTKYICITVPRRLGNILFLFDVKQWRPFQIFCFLILLACSSLYLWFQHALCLWRFWCKDASSFLVQKSHLFEGKEPSVSSHVQKEKTTKQRVRSMKLSGNLPGSHWGLQRSELVGTACNCMPLKGLSDVKCRSAEVDDIISESSPIWSLLYW